MSTDTPQPGPAQRTAQDLVKEIAKERGYLGEEQLARIGEINPELRREVEEALLRKDEMIGSAVLTYVLYLKLRLPSIFLTTFQTGTKPLHK